MTSARRWRGSGVVALVVAVLALVGGVAVAVVTFNGSGTGSASTAAVTLAVDSSVSHTCAYANLAPGDLPGASPHPCVFAVGYTGSVPAYLSLTLLVQTQAGPGPGSRPLYDPVAGAGLTMTVTDSQSPPVTYTTPRQGTTCPTSAPAGATCYRSSDDLVSTSAFAPAQRVTFTLVPSFGAASGSAYQGGEATILLSVQAVQAAANPLPSSCNTSTLGQPCPPNGSFTWS